MSQGRVTTCSLSSVTMTPSPIAVALSALPRAAVFTLLIIAMPTSTRMLRIAQMT